MKSSSIMKSVSDLRVQIFADGADKASILELSRQPHIKGFTTNPTLMRATGVTDYEGFARELLTYIPDRPISFEVFADDFTEMKRQTRVLGHPRVSIGAGIGGTISRGGDAREAGEVAALQIVGNRLLADELADAAPETARIQAVHDALVAGLGPPQRQRRRGSRKVTAGFNPTAGSRHFVVRQIAVCTSDAPVLRHEFDDFAIRIQLGTKRPVEKSIEHVACGTIRNLFDRVDRSRISRRRGRQFGATRTKVDGSSIIIPELIPDVGERASHRPRVVCDPRSPGAGSVALGRG